MNLLRKVLLGSSMALISVAGVSAADLGVKKPSPVEYVKVCNTYGAGYFFIPGSNTCLKIGGRVRAEVYLYGPQHQGFNVSNNTGFRVNTYIQLDARTNTEYGTLRTFVRLLLNSRTGRAVSGSQQRFGTSTVATGADFANNAQTNVDLQGFIQFAGFTAGRAQSFFDFIRSDFNYSNISGTGNNLTSGATNLFAYTHSFGGGLSASFSVEDPIERRNLILLGRDNFITAANGLGRANVLNPTAPAANAASFYGGSQQPDFVANVRWEQAWGQLQVGGALHEVTVRRIANNAATNTLRGDTAGLDGIGAAVSRDYGRAVNAGIKINLPFIAAGDLLGIQVAYGKGAIAYTDSGAQSGSDQPVSTVVDTFNPLIFADGYGYADRTGRAQISLSDSYNVLVGFRHYWTPTIRQNIYGSYSRVTYGRAAAPVVASVGTNLGINGITRFQQFQVGSNLTWSPVKDLDIGADIQYNGQLTNNRGANYSSGVLPLNQRDNAGNFVSRIRIQRDF